MSTQRIAAIGEQIRIAVTKDPEAFAPLVVALLQSQQEQIELLQRLIETLS